MSNVLPPYFVRSVTLTEDLGYGDELCYLVDTSFGLKFFISRRSCRLTLLSSCCGAAIKTRVGMDQFRKEHILSLTATAHCDLCQQNLPYMDINMAGDARPVEQIAVEALLDPLNAMMVIDALADFIDELRDLPNSPSEWSSNADPVAPETIQAQLDLLGNRML